MKTDPIFVEEKDNFQKLLDIIKAGKSKLESSLNVIGKENLQKLKELREDPETNGSDFLLYLDTLQSKNDQFNIKDKYKRLDEMNSAVNEPYFARIDVKRIDDEKPVSYYIGKFGYTENKPIITDWRAKIASLYYRYRYPQKDVSFDTPLGKEVCDMSVKRTFEIDNGTFIKYFNNDIQLDENEIISDKIEQRTGGVLEDIVETIQISQMDIIEADPRQICIVQGCVGSGKSTVAIHKLSHIFFNYPTLIKPERSILIAKNQILVGYLSTLFPKLGLFDLNYNTLREILVHVIFREELGLTFNFEDQTGLLEFDLANIKKLKRNVSQIHEVYQQRLEEIFSEEEFSDWGGFKYNYEETISENIDAIVSELEEEILIQKETIKEYPRSIKGDIAKDYVKTIRKLITKLKKLRLELRDKQFTKLLKDYGVNKEEKLSYTKTLIFIYTFLEVFGIKKYIKYDYCVIDEGQDFSLLEYAVLGKLVMRGRFAIFGDLNQSIKDEGLTSWEEIKEVISDAKSANTFILETNYRSTKPIIDLANKVLGKYTQSYLPKSINRKGKDPEIIKFTNPEELFRHFVSQLESDFHPLDKSIGIISFDKDLLKKAADHLEIKSKRGADIIFLNENTKVTYLPKGVYIGDFKDIKGLEFAKVYVLGLNLDKLNNFKQAKEAFVAITRAMNELHVYGIK